MPRAKSPKNGNARTKSEAAAAVMQATNGASNGELEAEIRVRAYELYEARGCTPGHEHEDWLVAEREVLDRHHQSA